MDMVRKKTLIIALCIVSVLGGGLYCLDRVAQRTMDHKFGRPANATVVGKESPKQHDDQSDEWKVYYTIDTDSFRGQLDPEIWQSIIATETERYERGDLRSTRKSRRWYDQIRVGDKLEVHYRWVGGGKIEILSVLNPSFDDQT